MIGGISSKGQLEEFEFWASLDVDFMMLGVAYDFFLEEDNVANVFRLRDKFGLNILIHPRPDGKFLQSPANPDAHELIFESLDRIRDLVHQFELINKIILHLTTYRIPKGNYVAFSEEQAITNSQVFYNRLKEYDDLTFVFENGYPPGTGWEELGYKKEHFEYFDLPDNSEFCLDTGHLNLSSLSVQDVTSLPYDMTCLHLHSNDGLSDQHKPITRENFAEWKIIEGLLSKDKYMVMEIKNDFDAVPRMIEFLKKNQIAP